MYRRQSALPPLVVALVSAAPVMRSTRPALPRFRTERFRRPIRADRPADQPRSVRRRAQDLAARDAGRGGQQANRPLRGGQNHRPRALRSRPHHRPDAEVSCSPRRRWARSSADRSRAREWLHLCRTVRRGFSGRPTARSRPIRLPARFRRGWQGRGSHHLQARTHESNTAPRTSGAARLAMTGEIAQLRADNTARPSS